MLHSAGLNMKLINKDLLSLEKGIPAGMQNVLNRQKKIMRVWRGLWIYYNG